MGKAKDKFPPSMRWSDATFRIRNVLWTQLLHLISIDNKKQVLCIYFGIHFQKMYDKQLNLSKPI